MRITLDDVIARHKKANPNTDYDYTKTVLGLTIHNKVKIKCKLHGDFYQAPHEHMKGQGCPECGKIESKKTKTTDINVFINESIKLFEDKFDYTKTKETYKNYKTNCIFHCNKHNLDFEYKPTTHLKSKYGGCYKCKSEAGLEKRNEKIKEKEKRLKLKEEKQRVKRELEEIKKLEKLKKIEERVLKQKLKEEHKNIVKDLKGDFIKKLQNKYGNKFDITYIDKYINSQTKITLFCNEVDNNGKVHGLFSVRPDYILTRGKCPKCCSRYSRNEDEFLEILTKLHNKRYTYFDLSNKKIMDKIKVLCNTCNKYFYPKLNDHINGSGCPYCNRSRYEVKVENVLKEQNINIQPQRKFEWLGKMSLDFYLPDYDIAIECQGKQHFEVVEVFGGKTEHLKVVERDKIKKQLCKENGIKLVYYLSEYFVKYLKEDDIYFTNEEELINFILSCDKNIVHL